MKEGRSRKRKRSKNSQPQFQESSESKQKITTATKKRKTETSGIHDKDENPTSSSAKPSKSSNFLDKMRARLSGGHFRMINEKLYTCTGKEALDYFKEDPTLFNMITCKKKFSDIPWVSYMFSNSHHVINGSIEEWLGYQEQMSHWPQLPVNVIVEWVRSHSPSLVVADFGCGDARLAKSVKNKVHSFDLVADDPSVVACDMSNTPLDSSSVDVAVFCLSLMGTNFHSYLQEAHRVLKPSGWLLIAEVKSRFDPNTGGADPEKFSKAVCDLGFTTVSKDSSNKMFILLYFRKKEKKISKNKEIQWPELKPCLYKRR